MSTHYVASHIWNCFRSSHDRTVISRTALNHQIAHLLYRQGFVHSLALGNDLSPRHNPHSKIWMWFRPGSMSNIRSISKPGRRAFATNKELRRVMSGRYCERLQYLGLRQPLELGEVIAIRTPVGVRDLHEAAEEGLGGEMMFSIK